MLAVAVIIRRYSKASPEVDRARMTGHGHKKRKAAGGDCLAGRKSTGGVSESN